MALRLFTWIPDTGSNVDTEPKIESVSFGDGYEQRTPKGLNFIGDNWSLTFSRPQTEALDIVQFLRDHGGYLPFLWKTPEMNPALPATKQFLCRKWARKRHEDNGTFYVVTCTFEQNFDPS
jgi:phage-related protein